MWAKLCLGCGIALASYAGKGYPFQIGLQISRGRLEPSHPAYSVTLGSNRTAPVDSSHIIAQLTSPRLLKPQPRVPKSVLRSGPASPTPQIALRQNFSSSPRALSMSDSRERPWSNNPNAPRIPYNLFFTEKAYIAGSFIASILYGTRKAPPACPPVRTNFICSVDFRGSHRAVLQVYDRVI